MLSTLILTTALVSQCQPAGYPVRRGWFPHHRRHAVCWSASAPVIWTTNYTNSTNESTTPAAVAVAVIDEWETADSVEEAAIDKVPPGDPYGFTAWLNATRAAYGLPAVGYDPNLSGWAAVNNSHQTSYGLGHFVMGPARRQNAGWGAYHVVVPAWLGSPGHRAALLDPTIRWIGIAGSGAYWTFNGN